MVDFISKVIFDKISNSESSGYFYSSNGISSGRDETLDFLYGNTKEEEFLNL